MPTTSKPKRGRPPRTAKPSEERLVSRVSPAELRDAERAAAKAKEGLSEFVRRAVAERVKRLLGAHSDPPKGDVRGGIRIP